MRDSAHKAWSLGEGSTFTVYKGGYLAVGPGGRNGHAIPRASDTSSGYGDMVEAYYDGWLIGPADDSLSKVVFSTNSDINNQFIGVSNTSVVLNGSATVKEDISLMYDLWLIAGSKLTIATGKTLKFIHGENDNKQTYKAIYGEPAKNSVTLAGETTNRSASQVIISSEGKIVTQNTDTPVLGVTLSVDQSVSSGTYTVEDNEEGEVELDSPLVNYEGKFYSSWSNGEGEE